MISTTAAVTQVGRYGIKTVPAVVVNGEVVACCDNSGPRRKELAAAGIGQPL
jgi:BRCT domain type II-containing protein